MYYNISELQIIKLANYAARGGWQTKQKEVWGSRKVALYMDCAVASQ